MNTIHLRVAAVLIDLAFLATAAAILKSILWIVVGSPVEGVPALGASSTGAGLMTAAYLAGAVIFYGVCGGVCRASPGKRLLGLHVAPIQGGSLGFLRALFREEMRLAEIVFFISGFFSFLNLLESRPTRTDELFGTYVRARRRT